LKKLFEEHIARIDRKIELYTKLSSRISGARLTIFMLTLLFAFLASGRLHDLVYSVILIGAVISFLNLMGRHKKVEQFIEKLGFLKQIKEEQIARLELNWDGIPFRNINRDNFLNHPYAQDLNIIGKRSLFQLMDTSIYEGSSNVLSGLLLNQSREVEPIKKRQQLIQELAPLQLFRDKLRVEALFTKSKTGRYEWSMEQMLDWLRLPKKTGFILPLVIMVILSVSNVTLGILAMIGKLSSVYVVISFVSYLIALKFTSDKVKGLFDAAFQMEKLLGSFSNILSHVERFKASDDKEISQFLKVYQKEDEKPSVILKKVRRFAIAASVQKNQVLGPLMNLVIPWDLYFSMRLENLKVELEPKITKWLDKFYELEALNSMANFAFLNGDYSFPTFDKDTEALFKAEDLGHPLIPENQKVANDFEVYPGKDLFLITGSNMAGKSTFLRTVGINLVLAYSGAPANARSLNTGLYRIFTSINVNDSLGDGLSHFYAEVKRLRELLDELNKDEDQPLFFFVDEIYKGTNNKERYAGSAAFLREVAGKNGIGMVSTHDLELADLESEIEALSNWHFVESIEGGKMSFEYKLKSGPCPSTNALEIMRIEGLPV
jgi:DNA mismatch repair ATPase MutS